MFNFKKYPELIPYYKKYIKNRRKLSRLATVSVEKDSTTASKKFNELFPEAMEFHKVYGQKIYELLKDVKPKLLNGATKEYEEWDEVIGGVATGDNIYKCLIGAVEEYGLYSFPPEYYDPNLTDKML